MPESPSASTTSPTPTDAWGYRPGLDGLRTVAIYLVVLFHAGLTRVSNGYLGVDVFFVLSGFLVTNVMTSEHRQTGSLRLGRFYARRIRRLLPAAVVLVTGVSAMTILVQPRLTRVGFVGDARSALLYVANWHFLGASTDYFAKDVNRSPFLHFWSLAIEEQFYVVFPIVLLGLLVIAARRRRAALVPLGLGVLLLASVIAQVITARTSSLRAYYGTHTRLYQLLAGALLAAGWQWLQPIRAALDRPLWRERTSRAGAVAAVALVALVLLSTDVVDLSVSTRGVLATLLAAVVVAAIEVAPRSSIGSALGRPTMTYLGKISYGTYLWHWPLIVLAREVFVLSPWEMAALAAVGATAMSALSFQVLETPIRRTARLATHPRAVVAIGLSCSVLVAFTAVPALLRSDRRPALAAASGGVGVDTTGDAALEAALAAVPPAQLDLAATEPPQYDESSCVAADPQTCVLHRGAGVRVHLIGDSNAIVMIPLLQQLAEQHDFTLSVSARVGCPWQDGLSWVTDNDGLIATCEQARADWYERIIPALHPDVIIAVHVPRDDGSRADGSMFRAADGSATGPIADVVRAATDASLDRLTASGARVVLFEPLPYDTADPTECLSGAATVGACAYQANADPFPTELLYREEASKRRDVFDIDADVLACPYLPVCVPMIDGELVFRNQFHVSNAWFLDHADQWWQLLRATGAF